MALCEIQVIKPFKKNDEIAIFSLHQLLFRKYYVGVLEKKHLTAYLRSPSFSRLNMTIHQWWHTILLSLYVKIYHWPHQHAPLSLSLLKHTTTNRKMKIVSIYSSEILALDPSFVFCLLSSAAVQPGQVLAKGSRRYVLRRVCESLWSPVLSCLSHVLMHCSDPLIVATVADGYKAFAFASGFLGEWAVAYTDYSLFSCLFVTNVWQWFLCGIRSLCRTISCW